MLQSGLQPGESSGPVQPGAGDGEASGRLDRAALAELYRQHVAGVYRYHYERVGNRQDAEDLTAVTFAKALASSGDYAEQGRFAGWLFTIARHTLLDHLRQRKQHLDLDLVASLLPTREGSPEEETLRAERAHTLRRLIRNLPDDQREALSLRFFADLTTAETARALGRSEAATKMLVHRAFVTLRERYAREVQP